MLLNLTELYSFYLSTNLFWPDEVGGEIIEVKTLVFRLAMKIGGVASC